MTKYTLAFFERSGNLVTRYRATADVYRSHLADLGGHFAGHAETKVQQARSV